MKPVVANPSETFENLIARFKASDTDKKFKSKQIKFSSNFNGQKNIFHSENLEQFKNLNGGKNPNEFIAEIKNSSADGARKILLRHTDLFRLLQQKILNSGRPFVLSEYEDS